MNEITASVTRKTLETQIEMTVTLGGDGPKGLLGSTGIGFFDHMLNSLAIHAGLRIGLEMAGDLHVDCHHTVEDTGIVLGLALRELASKAAPLKRYGCSHIPMDEALARAVIDVSGRPYLVFDYQPASPMVGQFDTQMAGEFFRAVAFNMGATLHMAVLYGANDHHMIEALFKAFAHALADAMAPIGGDILSAKGVL